MQNRYFCSSRATRQVRLNERLEINGEEIGTGKKRDEVVINDADKNVGIIGSTNLWFPFR